MADLEVTAATEAEEEQVDGALVVKLRKPYVFEGETYTQIDLSGLENVNGQTLENATKAVNRRVKGLHPATLETTMDYAQEMAVRVTGLPLEFFQRLPAKDCIALKGAVVGFLFDGGGED